MIIDPIITNYSLSSVDSVITSCQPSHLSILPKEEKEMEKERAILSSILAWRIPWMEEPGRL